MQKIRLFVTCLSLNLVICMGAPALAESGDEIDQLLEMDIKQLTLVSVASKKEESSYDAPSVISVVTREDIQRYGARSLVDVLNRIPSFQYTSGLFFQNNSFSARGQSTQHYANRMLFLINGRPFRDSFSGAFNSPLYTKFPVSMVERLEVIRGPGSVLYGSGAFSAVINIVTRKAEKDGSGASAAATYGAHNYRDGELSSIQAGPGWNVAAAARATAQDGWDTQLTSELGTVGRYGKEGSGHSLFSSAQFENLAINAFHGRDVYDGLFRTFPTDKRDVARTFFDIGYTHDLGERWKISENLSHNRLDFVSGNHLTGIEENNASTDTLIEVTARGRLSDSLNVLLGGTNEFQEGIGFNTQMYESRWYTAYAQAEYMLTERLKLVAGLQMNKPGDLKKDFSPRGGAVYQFNENWGSKLLYGEAFRSGYALETFLTIPGVLSGNPALNPETTATTEAQVFYHDDAREAALTVYKSKATSIIQRGPAVPGPGLTYLNGGKVRFHGVEFEGKARIGHGWEAQGSLMWQKNEDGAGAKDVTFSPNWMAKAGISYSSPRGYSVGLFDNYFGSPTPVRVFNAGVLEANPQPGSYHLVTMNAEFDLDAFVPGNIVSGASFTVFADNLLNEDIYYPEYNRRNVNSLPVNLGRAVYGTLKIDF